MPPPPPPAARMSAPGPHSVPLPSDADLTFVKALRDAGLLQDFDDRELARAVTAQQLRNTRGLARSIDLLETYYGAGGDAAIAASRRARDRYFIHREDDAVTALRLVERLAALAPEVGVVVMERIGGLDGQLVLRAGEQIAAVVDDYEESLETNEIDLRDLDPGQTITIRGLVRAINVLLSHVGVRSRLLPLRSDVQREVYLGVDLSAAMELATGGVLEDEDAGEVMDLGNW